MSTKEVSNRELLAITHDRDKIFPQSDKVEYEKVIFKNLYDIPLVGDLYIP